MSQDAIATIDAFLAEIAAEEKRANYDPSDTSHPSGKAEDGTQDKSEGFRAREYESDMKAEPNLGDRQVDKVEPVSSGDAADAQPQQGLKQAPTGEDPEHETSSASGSKDDPGSSHPARSDNDELGGKYSCDQLEKLSLDKLAALLQQLGNELCAEIAASPDPSSPPSAPRAASAKAAWELDPRQAEQAGYSLADPALGQFDKQAADALVEYTLAGVIKEAADDATRVAAYLSRYQAAKAAALAEIQEGASPTAPAPQYKQAMPGMPPSMPPGGAGGGPDQAPTQGDESELLEALSQGGGGEGGGMGGGMGGGGEMPPQGGEDEAAALAQVLDELGVSPEELMQALQQEAAQGGGGMGSEGGGGGMGGMPPGGGGMDPSMMGGGGPPMEPPKAAAASKSQKFAAMRADVQELISRSRRR